MSSVALIAGTEIGGFRLGNVIGRGGFGITYRAEDKQSGQVYAIKEYLPEDFANRDRFGLVTASSGQSDIYDRGLKAFLTEANILKTLPRRKGLVRVRGAFEKFGTAYCVMEFIEGDSLDRMARRLIRQYGHIPQDLIKDLAASICWALDALHRENLIHRDVKPANIMLRRGGMPVLIDFGAARHLSQREEKEMIFTRSFAAIEQIPPSMSGFDRAFPEGSWTDVFALSVVLYQLVTHKLPPDAMSRAKAVLAGDPDPYVPLSENPEFKNGANPYDLELLETIDHGCRLMPKQRIQNTAEFAKRLSSRSWEDVKSTPESSDVPYEEESDWTVDAEQAPERDFWKNPFILPILFGLTVVLIYLAQGNLDF